jgi:hypothetical protein
LFYFLWIRRRGSDPWRRVPLSVDRTATVLQIAIGLQRTDECRLQR